MNMLKLRTWFKVHKWISIFTGIVLLMWLITGLVMSWGRLFPEPRPAEPTPPDFRAVTMPPAEAVAHLEAILGQSPQVSWMDLRQILDRVVYEIQLQDGSVHLIETQSGQEFKITPELAEQIALAKFPTQTRVLQIERLDHYDFRYSFGPLPVYRIAFEDNWTTYLHVSIRTGEVRRDDLWSRIRGVLGSLHTFGVLRIITDRGRLITAMLWGATFVTFFAAVVGYYLALPRRWQVF